MAVERGFQTTVWLDSSDDIAAVMPTARESTAQAQTESHQFIVEHGAELTATATHGSVTGPSGGAGGDSDIAGPDASDL